MSDKEIEIYNENADEIKIRPYEHHAKYYETDQMGIIHHSNISNGWKKRGWTDGVRSDSAINRWRRWRLSVRCSLYPASITVWYIFDDTVVIETKITRYNGIKMDVEYRMTDKETGELRTTGKSSH